MHIALGNVWRGLVAGAITSDGAALLSAWNGTTTWHEAIGVWIGSGIMLAAALIDPGSKPPKAEQPK